MVAHPGTHRLGGAGFYRKRSLDENLIASGQILGLREPRPTILGPRRVPGAPLEQTCRRGVGKAPFLPIRQIFGFGQTDIMG
jgi:hypothetical protein